MNNTRCLRRALAHRIAVLTEELATCTTAAMRRCVQESIDDARRQLAAC